MYGDTSSKDAKKPPKFKWILYNKLVGNYKFEWVYVKFIAMEDMQCAEQ
jgi:hypothetical protein